MHLRRVRVVEVEDCFAPLIVPLKLKMGPNAANPR